MAQAVYYFTSALALGAPERKVSYCVPTGNFGDIFAGQVARHRLVEDRLGQALDEVVRDGLLGVGVAVVTHVGVPLWADNLWRGQRIAPIEPLCHGIGR